MTSVEPPKVNNRNVSASDITRWGRTLKESTDGLSYLDQLEMWNHSRAVAEAYLALLEHFRASQQRLGYVHGPLNELFAITCDYRRGGIFPAEYVVRIIEGLVTDFMELNEGL